MGFFDLYRCPNTNCWWNEKGKEGEICPVCGIELEMLEMGPKGKDLSPKGGAYVRKEKDKLKNNPEYIKLIEEYKQEQKKFKKEQKEKKRLNRLLFQADAGDDDIISSIESDMHNLASHEAGTKWMRIGTLLTFNVTQQMMGAGFKAIIDQNKILIKQNELIYRELKKLNEK